MNITYFNNTPRPMSAKSIEYCITSLKLLKSLAVVQLIYLDYPHSWNLSCRSHLHRLRLLPRKEMKPKEKRSNVSIITITITKRPPRIVPSKGSKRQAKEKPRCYAFDFLLALWFLEAFIDLKRSSNVIANNCKPTPPPSRPAVGCRAGFPWLINARGFVISGRRYSRRRYQPANKNQNPEVVRGLRHRLERPRAFVNKSSLIVCVTEKTSISHPLDRVALERTGGLVRSCSLHGFRFVPCYPSIYERRDGVFSWNGFKVL